MRDPYAVAPLVYRRITPPAAAPVALDRVRRHLRLDEADTDATETDLITAAITSTAELLDGRTGILNRALVTQTWQATTARPASCVVGGAPGFVIDLAPLQAVVTVEYLSQGSYVELAGTMWRATPLPGERQALIMRSSCAWPACDRDPEAWRITFRAGYGDAGDAVPSPIRSAMLLMVADLFDNRDAKVQANLVENATIDRLLAPYRRVGI